MQSHLILEEQPFYNTNSTFVRLVMLVWLKFLEFLLQRETSQLKENAVSSHMMEINNKLAVQFIPKLLDGVEAEFFMELVGHRLTDQTC